MNFPYWVIYSYIVVGVALLIFDIVNLDYWGIFSSVCIIAIGAMAIWNKRNPSRKV